MKFLIVHIISLCLIVKCSESITNRFSSSCLVDPCDSNNQGGSCSSSNVCYRFETSRNTTLCAPQITCSLFDPCSSSKTCSSNATVCVLNSCCLVPVCMPVALASTCTSTNNNTVTPTASSTARPPQTTPGNVCSNALWTDIEETVLRSIWLDSNGVYINDFTMDLKNNFFLSIGNSHLIAKVSWNNTSTYSVIGICNETLDYTIARMFVDSNGYIYTAENRYDYVNGYSRYSRVAMYVEGNGTNGTVLFGEVTCGNRTDQICGCDGLFVDNQGFIYCSDSANHRVVKITAFSTTTTVIAGTSGVAGWATNQLNSPGGIYVDSNNNLYVADKYNFRVMMFTNGNPFGTVLFTVGLPHAPNFLTLDNSGTIYVVSYTGLYRFIRSSAQLKSIVNSAYFSYSKPHLDATGNIYALIYAGYNMRPMNDIIRYNIIPNLC